MAISSLAGPMTNFVVAFIAYLILVVIDVCRPLVFYLYDNRFYYDGKSFWGITAFFLFSLISVNIGLGFFNLIPVPPLDGYHLLRHAIMGHVKPQTLWNFERYGRFLLIGAIFLFRGFISGGVIVIYNAFESVWSYILSLFL